MYSMNGSIFNHGFFTKNHISFSFILTKKKKEFVTSLAKNTIIHSENSKEKLSNTRLSTKPYDLWLASY